MVAINGTSVGYIGTSGNPSIDTIEWGKHQAAFGNEYFVDSMTAGRVTFLSGTTVRVGAGVIGGQGVVDTLTSPTDVPLPTPGVNGTIHYTIVARRTWQTSNATTLVYLTGNATRAIAAGRNVSPGVIDDQPLAVVAVTRAGASITVSVVDDLRAIGHGKGYFLAYSEMVLSYMTKPGYQIRIGNTGWLRTLAGTWEPLSSPIEKVTAFGSSTPDSGWTYIGLGSYLIRDGKRREMLLEQRLVAGTLQAGSDGSVANRLVFALDDAKDRPQGNIPLTMTYVETPGGGDFAGRGVLTVGGSVYLNSLLPNGRILSHSTVGQYSTRYHATWYVS